MIFIVYLLLFIVSVYDGWLFYNISRYPWTLHESKHIKHLLSLLFNQKSTLIKHWTKTFFFLTSTLTEVTHCLNAGDEWVVGVGAGGRGVVEGVEGGWGQAEGWGASEANPTSRH